MPFLVFRDSVVASGAFSLTVAALLIASLAGSSLAQEQEKQFSGTVVDVQGNPIAGVQVFLIPLARPEADQTGLENVKCEPTDAEGKFSTAYDSSIFWQGLVYKPGFVPWFHQLTPQNGRANSANSKPSVGEIKLERSKSVRLTILEHDGKPANLKSVRVGWCGFRDKYVSWPNDVTIPLPVSVDGNLITCDWLPMKGKGWISLEVDTGSAKRSVAFSYEPDSLAVALPPTTKLRGRIEMKDGAKLADDFVSALALNLNLGSANSTEESFAEASPPAWRVRQAGRVEIESDGSFEMDCIVGKGRLRLGHKELGVQLKTQEVSTQLGEVTDVKLVVTMPQIVKGRVVDEAGEPIEGVTISNAVTDKLGEFEFAIGNQPYYSINSVPAGCLEPMHGKHRSIDVDSAKPGEPIVVPDIVVRKATPGSGRVIDEEGNPVAGAKVVAEWVFREDRHSTKRTDSAISDSEGNFTLRSVLGGVDVRLTARTDDMASADEVVTQFGADAQPAEIVLSTNAAAKCSVKVTNSAGQPVKNAQIKMYSKSNSKMLGYYGRQARLVLSPEECLTDADGSFEFPEKLVRRYEYSIKVSANGFVNYDRAGITMPTEGGLSIGDIVLEPTRSVEGSVVDSSGKPVAGASVWSHGIAGADQHLYERKKRPKGSVSKSDEAGEFKLTGIHPDAAFVFVSKVGSVSSGAKIVVDQPAKLTLRSTEESIKDPLSFAWATSNDSTEALEDHLDFMLEERSSSWGNGQMLDALLRVNSKQVDEFIDFFSARSTKARGLAARGHFEDALEVCQFQTTPSSRARAMSACAKATNNESQKIAFLEEAAFEISNILETPSRIERASGVIDQLLDLGQIETAKSLVESNMPAALKINNEDRNEFSKAWFAKAAVRVDYENSWNLIKDSKTSKNETSGGFGRHCGNMAHELAAVDPERAEKLLLEMEDRDQIRYVPRVVCRMVKKHPEKALKILDQLLPDPTSVKSSWEKNRLASSSAMIATVIADSHPSKAKELIGRAVEASSIDANNQYGLGASLSLLVGAIELDPIIAENVFWKMVDEFADPNAATYSVEKSRELRARNSSNLAVLLGLTGRFPDVQAAAVEGIYAGFKGQGELSSSQVANMHDNPIGFAAIAMHDPKHAATWHKAFYERIPENDRRRIPSPWSVIANTLSMDGQALCNYVTGSIMHEWIPGTED